FCFLLSLILSLVLQKKTLKTFVLFFLYFFLAYHNNTIMAMIMMMMMKMMKLTLKKSIKFSSLLIICIEIITIFTPISQSQTNRRKDVDDLKRYNQQVIETVPKLNLAAFNLDQFGTEEKFLKSERKKAPPSPPRSSSSSSSSSLLKEREDETKHSLEPIDDDSRNDWEYFERRPSRPRPRIPVRPSSRPSSTTSRPYHRFRPSSTTTTTTSKPSISSRTTRYPIHDCSDLCVPKHFLQHYYLRKCRPSFSRDCNCAKSFTCPDENDDHNRPAPLPSQIGEYCSLNSNQRYPIGYVVPVPDRPCSVCRCLRDYSIKERTVAKIDCSDIVECPEKKPGAKPSRPDCYYSYAKDRCCGVEICPDRLKWDDERLRKCRYRNPLE
ncbi:hypothetical protein SSS_04258, partial [Sarcoptes scabiei]